jgi:mannitol-1-/sugar-/sorbitol-6-/2-deoxyglucose-6-phosphatase
MIRAIIFDFDGVLVDSHGIINKLFSDIANKELGLNITEKEFADNPGIRFEHRLMKINSDRKLNIPPEKIMNAIEKGRFEYFSNKSDYVRLYPGVIELLSSLKEEGMMICLGSNGGRRSIEKLMQKLGIKKYFSSIVTFDDVENGKPNPEMFLKNAHNLKLNPEECIVIEDAVEGIIGAHAAGMKVIAVATTTGKKELKDADLVVKTIKDINTNLIQRLS